MNSLTNTICAALVALIIGAAGGFYVGGELRQAAWDKDRLEMQSARAKAVAELVNKYDADRLTNERKAREATAKHDQALSDLDRAYERDLAAVRRAGGLRIPRAAACSRPAAAGETASARGPDEGAAATVELPERTQERLFNLTLRADRLAEQLRGLQGWVMSNGFYGTADENPGNP